MIELQTDNITFRDITGNEYRKLFTSRCYQLKRNDIFYISSDGKNATLKPGDKYYDYNAVVIEVVKEKGRRWSWLQFWKKRKILGYRVMVL